MTEFNISPSVETQKEISEILDEAIEKLRDIIKGDGYLDQHNEYESR